MRIRFYPLLLILIAGTVSTALGIVPDKLSSAGLDSKDSRFSTKRDILYFNKKPFQKIQVERYDNGALFRETQYKNGLKNGYEKRFTLDGSLRALWNYKSGKKDGEQKGWFEDGTKQFVFHYKNGMLEGEQTEWHQNGVLFRQQVFHNGYESSKKILYSGGEVFTNYVKRDQRVYGIDGGALCFEKKKDGER